MNPAAHIAAAIAAALAANAHAPGAPAPRFDCQPRYAGALYSVRLRPPVGWRNEKRRNRYRRILARQRRNARLGRH